MSAGIVVTSRVIHPAAHAASHKAFDVSFSLRPGPRSLFVFRPGSADPPQMLFNMLTPSSRMLRRFALPALGSLVLFSSLRAQALAGANDLESPAARETRIQWFRQAKFGLFIHW